MKTKIFKKPNQKIWKNEKDEKWKKWKNEKKETHEKMKKWNPLSPSNWICASMPPPLCFLRPPSGGPNLSKGSPVDPGGWLATLAEFLWVLSLARMGQGHALRWPLLPRSQHLLSEISSRGSHQVMLELATMRRHILSGCSQASSKLRVLSKKTQALHSAYSSSWVIREQNSNSARRFWRTESRCNGVSHDNKSTLSAPQQEPWWSQDTWPGPFMNFW